MSGGHGLAEKSYESKIILGLEHDCRNQRGLSKPWELTEKPLCAEELHESGWGETSFEGLVFELGHLWEELNGSKIVLLIPLFSHSNSGEFSALTHESSCAVRSGV